MKLIFLLMSKVIGFILFRPPATKILSLSTMTVHAPYTLLEYLIPGNSRNAKPPLSLISTVSVLGFTLPAITRPTSGL